MLSSIHPFPARMAPSIVLDELNRQREPLTVVDPMAGSGTTIVAARLQGHRAIGFDVDPLAVLIAKAWSVDVSEEKLHAAGESTLRSAWRYLREITQAESYPSRADEETRKFTRYWFDPISRRQLTALCFAIRDCKNAQSRNLLWCAFSRMIITKSDGVSLAMDVSHSRPHRVYDDSPRKPFDQFRLAIRRVAKASLFKHQRSHPAARVAMGDARHLPLRSAYAHVVITSPPYLNAIDYLRGHRLSLIWMGYSLSSLRRIRSEAIGSEHMLGEHNNSAVEEVILSTLDATENASFRLRGILSRYVRDMFAAVSEMKRILKPDGRLILVVGDSTTKGFFINTSGIVREVAERIGLELHGVRRRALPDSRRYLPPPDSRKSGSKLGQRLRTEVVLKFKRIE